MKPIKLLVALAAAGLIGAFGAMPTHAAQILAPLFNLGGATLLSDNSAELFFDRDGSGTVSVDDGFVTILGINTIGPTTIGAGTAFNELTIISAFRVATASDVDLGPLGPDDSFGSQAIDLWQFTFAPLTAADTGVLDFSTLNCGGAVNDGLTVSCAYEDPAQDYTRDSTIAAGISGTTNGLFRLRLESNPLNGDFFSTTAPLTIADFGTVPFATAIDNTNISLDFTIAAQSWPGLLFAPNITGGNGGLSSPSAASEFPIFDNLDFTANASAVPEPTTLLLFGSGLLGLAVWGARREKIKRG